MNSLVTGSTGFIGRHVIAALGKAGDPARAMYRDEQRARLYLTSGEARIRGDACDPAVLREAVVGVDVVYHCAAAHSTESDEVIRRTNFASVENLFAAVREAGSSARIVLMSSINVLGSRNFANADESAPRVRTGDLHVDLKIEAEELAERSIADGLDVVILRPGLVYGVGDVHLAKLARAISRGKFAYLGSRDNIVPLVHVSDMVDAMIAAAHAAPATGRIYHVTDGTRTTISELAGRLARALGCREPQRVVPLLVPRLANTVCGILGRSGPVSPAALRFLGTSRHVSIDLARAELGFEPKRFLADVVEEMAPWLRETLPVESAA